MSAAAPSPGVPAVSADLPPEVQARIQAHIDRLLHQQDLPGIATNYGATALMVWIHWSAVARATLLGWMTLWLAANTAYLAFSLVNGTGAPRTGPAARRWSLVHLFVANVLSVAPASLVPWLLSPTQELLYLNTMLLVIYCAGVYASLAAISPLAFGLAGAVLVVPAAVVHLMSGAGSGAGLAAALVMFYLFLVPFAVVQARGLRNAVRVAFENEELARRLAAETEAARAARQRAEEANRAKARFLAAATHDLRQPLHAMSLTLEAMRGQAPGDGPSHPDRLRDCTRQLSAMFDALLDQAHLDAGTRVLAPAPLPLASLFAQIETQFQPVAQARGLWLRCRPTQAVLEADPMALWRIAANLVSNALEATTTGGVLVAWRTQRRALEVRDSGCGIAAEHHDTIFQEFRRIARSGAQRERGLGLGLATVRGLAGLMGAEVSLRSAPGCGSTFRVRFEPGSVLPAAAPHAVAGPQGAHADRLPPPGSRALAVDDDPAVLGALHDLLRQWGLEVRVAASAEEARRVAARWRPDLLILDRHLPDASGTDLARALCALHDPPPRCLMVTGDTSPDDLQAIVASGMEVMFKPVSPEQLLGAVARLLR